MSIAPNTDSPLVIEEITLDGKRVQVQSVDLPLEQVELDPHNPRIADVAVAITQQGAALQGRLEALLWDDAVVRDLCRQVLINEGLVERIIVRSDGRVVEGNCRTVVYRKLRELQPTAERWRTIPARLLPAGLTDRNLAILLGEMHVAGKTTWTPFEKASHVYRLHNDFALVQHEIAVRLHMSKSKVNQLIRAFGMMKTQFLPSTPDPPAAGGSGASRKYSRNCRYGIGSWPTRITNDNSLIGSVQANSTRLPKSETLPRSSKTKRRSLRSPQTGLRQRNVCLSRTTQSSRPSSSNGWLT